MMLINPLTSCTMSPRVNIFMARAINDYLGYSFPRITIFCRIRFTLELYYTYSEFL